jgi:GxxExxY protein
MERLRAHLSAQCTTDSLGRRVIGAAMTVHRILGCGFLETVYRNALAIQLRKQGIPFELHPTLTVKYEGEEIGSYQADLIIEGRLIVELKAVEALAPVHASQLINYLTATGLDEGLLLNFGAKSLQFRTKTKNAPSRARIDSQLLP